MVIDVPPEVLIQRLQEFGKLWQKFIELFNRGLETELPTQEEEDEFRNLQVEITRRAQFLAIAIPEKRFDLWKDIKKLLVECPSLRILKREVPIRISSFRSLWHEVSISLNQKQGQLRIWLEEKEHGKVKKKK